MNKLDRPTYCAYYCPECEWFRIGDVSGRQDRCADCDSLLREKVLTITSLGLTETFDHNPNEEHKVGRQQKGDRHENEAKRILSRRYTASKVSTWGNHDPFKLVDIIAIHPERRPKFVQVKTNGFNGRGSYRELATARIPVKHVQFEVWDRRDNEGWRLYRFDGEEFNQFGEIDSCEYDEAVRQWLYIETGEMPRPLSRELTEFE